MKVYQTNEIRNIALIGGAKAGKTTLAECMLFEGGVISRRGSVDDKNTVSDYREVELERQNSVYSTVLYSEFEGKKINIIDAPGFDDFIGEVVSALKVCETALMVINAQNGVEVGTEITWRYTNRNDVPVVFVVNQLDHEKANFDEVVRQLKNFFGPKVTLAQYPVEGDSGFGSVIDLLKMKMLKFDKEGKHEVQDIPASEAAKAEELHTQLIEAAAEGDESLMETFFEKGTLTEEELQRGLKLSLMQRGIFPVFCVAAKSNTGVNRLMEYISTSLPAPDEMHITKNAEGETVEIKAAGEACAFVFKTSIEPHLGDISFFKVITGEITEAMDLINQRNTSRERFSQLLAVAGKNREKINKVVAGDIAATIKLKSVNTNDTVSVSKNSSLVMEPIAFPEPKFRTAVRAINSSDDEKLGAVLTDMHKVDRTLIAKYSKELKQLIIAGQGELHLTIAKWQIEKLHKIDIEFYPPKIQYRETITKPAKSMYRHKKQSGGAGQFGEVHMMIEPYVEGMKNQTEFPTRGRKNTKWNGVANLCSRIVSWVG
jgi:elongation factor G